MLNVGLIGAGFIGSIHARNICSSGLASLASVFDTDAARAAEISKRHGAAAAASYRSIFQDPQIDAVVIAAATDAHGELAVACAEAGKPFLLEKPIDVSLEAAARTAAAVRKTGVFAGMGFSRRFDRQHRALKAAVDGGDAGRIEIMRLTSRTQSLPDLDYISVSGGQLRDKGSHFFDLACWISGERPVEIFASGDCLVEPRFAQAGDCDTMVVMLRMRSGAFCVCDFARRTTYGYDERIEVFGSGGRIESRSPAAMDLVRYQGDKAISAGLHAHWLDRLEGNYAPEIEAFLNEVTAPTGEFPTIDDGLTAECIAEAGYRSMNSNSPVRIDYSQVD